MLLGGMGCLVSHLAAKLAFFPPRPSTYQVKKQEDGKLVVVSSTVSHDDNSMDVRVLDTKRGNKIVAFYMKNPYARLTLLYSHGNAADLGQLYDLFAQLKINLRVNLMGYDYSGYGASTGKPSEYDTYADIEAVYECLQTEYGISQEDLILYGQSVGSGPTLHLAAKLPRLRGVVLHSAILSGLRVLCQLKVTFCFDIYKNINKIRKVKCPVLVIHGTEDDVVNWFHGNGLWKLSRDPYEPLWIKGGGHCNLELYPDYVRHLSGFVKDMENQTTKTRLKKIKQNLRKPLKSSTHTTNSSKKCCRIRCCRVKIRFRWPKCLKCSRPKCSRPNCLKCSRPKCLKCSRPKCLKCSGPNCLKCLRPNCLKCLCLKNCLKCSCLKNCLKCSCLKCSGPKCLKCSRPNCLKCSRPKCCCIKLFCWC